MTRRALSACIASVLIFLELTTSTATTAGQKPNVVILFADDLGYGDLGCYGHPSSTTPNIDKMAAEGLRFTDFYVTSPVCSPSRASLLTGRYQTRSGVYPLVFFPGSDGGHLPGTSLSSVNFDSEAYQEDAGLRGRPIEEDGAIILGLPHTETTIAEYLKGAGYSTGMVGKWHLGVGANGEYLPTNHGFDQYLGVPYAHDECPCHNCFYPNQSCFNDCYPMFVACPLYKDMDIIEQPVKLTTLDERMVSSATDYIKTQAEKKNPFFLYMAFQHVHHPQYAGEKFTNSSIRGPFGDALNEMDDGVGQILAALKDAGVADNTFVFFTSDNGPSFIRETRGGNSGLLKCGKGTTYEGGMRVPAVAWWPGKIAPGVTRELTSTLELLPTILKLADVQPKGEVVLDGYDMTSVLFDSGKSPRETFYYYPTMPAKLEGVYAMRYQQYKAHFYTIGSLVCTETYPDVDCRPSHTQTHEVPPLLYQLQLDPSEIYNLTKGEQEYDSIMKIMLEERTKFNLKMTWAPSQMAKRSDSNEPCANKGCSPFPQCCHT